MQDKVAVDRKGVTLNKSTLWVGATTFVFVGVGLGQHGIGGALMWLSVIAAITGISTLITKRPSWANLRSRTMGGTVVGISLVTLVLAGVMIYPTDDQATDVADAVPRPAASQKPIPTRAPSPSASGVEE